MRQSVCERLPLGATVTPALSLAAVAKDVSLSGDFTGEHGATHQPSGHVDAALDTVTHKLKYTIDYEGLSGPVTIAHFRGPAKAGVDASVRQLFPGPHPSGLSNTVTIDGKSQSAMLEGMTCVNLHTKAQRNGEARAEEGK